MLSHIPIHRFSTRYNLIFGCDRELIMFIGLIAFTLGFTSQNTVSIIFGISLWVAGLFLLRMMAKADPLLRFTYLRHIRYKKYYPARSTPFRQNMREY